MKTPSPQRRRWWARKESGSQDAGGDLIEKRVSFFGLWRHATLAERLLTLLGCASAGACACALQAAIMLYGELTALLPARAAAASAPRVWLLPLFGGGRLLDMNSTRPERMDALVEDSIAFAWGSVAIMAGQWAGAAIAVSLTSHAAHTMTTRLRYRVMQAALRQELGFYDINKSFNITTVITEDMEKLRLATGPHAAMAAYLSASVGVAAGAALALGWELALVGLAVVPLAVAVAALAAKYQARYAAEESSAIGAATRAAEQALAGARTVRACQAEPIEMGRFARLVGVAAATGRRRGAAAGAGAGAGWLLTYALNALVLACGARLCVRDMDAPPGEQRYNPGVMVTILFSTFMAAQNITMCHPHLEVMSAARGAARAMHALLVRVPRVDALGDSDTKNGDSGTGNGDSGDKRPVFRGDIRFENVYFNYPSRPDAKVLRGLTLSVRAGETVALVGGSGCGKSTLLQLLLRLYEPDCGALAVDGRPLAGLDLQHYRTSIGVVGQEPVLFAGTVRDNITLGLQGVSQARVEQAARTAHAHGFISKLKQGYETQVGAGGAALSGGQKQRVAIARALLRDPKILLLDEPTSALDPAAERQVQAALDAASQGRTTLVVSHRLSTIVNATRVVYIEQGAVLEQGTYHELLEQKGLFYKLVQADLSRKDSPAPAPADDDEILEAQEQPEPFRREFTRRDSTRESLTPERMARGSLRAGSVAAAHVPGATADLAHVELDEEEAPATEDEALEPVSTWRLLRLNAPERLLLAGGAAAALLLGGTMPAFALLFSKIYGMFASRDPTEILRQATLYAGLFGACAALCGAGTWLQTWLFHSAGARLTERLRLQVFQRFLTQEQAWLDRPENSVGALCARLATDCAAVQGATGTRLGTVLMGVSTMTLGVGLAALYSWKMTLVSLLSVPCVMGGIYLEGWVMQRSEGRQRAAAEGAARVAAEALMHLRTVHSLGVGSTMLARYSAALESAAAAAAAAGRARGAVYGLCLCAPTLGYAVSLAYGGYLVAREDMPYAYAILVSEALIYGAWMLAEALSFAPSFAAARRSGARIVRLLALPALADDAGQALDDPSWSASGEIAFEDVRFAYPARAAAPVLRGLSLRLPPGHTAALVGASGCGKSTMLQLLARVYEPDGGHVSVSGRDVRALPRGVLRAQLGLVAQEPVLFERSIRENIAYGAIARFTSDEDTAAEEKMAPMDWPATVASWHRAERRLLEVPLERVMDAARQANVHEFIASLPLGYDTQLGAGGAALSGGQKQRVAIARALLRDPKILLLDEATSALDAGSEQVVQAALEAAARGRTTLLVAHRLATVRHAHTICVIDKGVVAERGSHAELVRRRGLYYDLLRQQAADDAPE